MATYDIDDLAVIPILAQTTDFDYTGDVQFIKLVEPLPFSLYVSAILLVIGVIVGMFGSSRAVRKYLKI